GILDGHRARTVVADKEDRATALDRVVVLDDAAGDVHGEAIAVGVDRPATATARRAAPRRVRSPADGLVVADHAVEHDPGDADAGQRAAVGTLTALPSSATEGALDDVHRPVLELVEDPDGGAAHVRPGRVAPA